MLLSGNSIKFRATPIHSVSASFQKSRIFGTGYPSGGDSKGRKHDDACAGFPLTGTSSLLRHSGCQGEIILFRSRRKVQKKHGKVHHENPAFFPARRKCMAACCARPDRRFPMLPSPPPLTDASDELPSEAWSCSLPGIRPVFFSSVPGNYSSRNRRASRENKTEYVSGPGTHMDAGAFIL